MPSPSKQSEPVSFNKTEIDLAEVIVRMRYGDLMEVSGLLADMINDADYKVKSADGMAALLHTWAESKLEG